jgi:hypothetical protein
VSYVQTVLADAPIHYWRLADGQSYILHDIGSIPYPLAVNNPATAGGYSGIEPGGQSMVSGNLGGSQNDTFTSTNHASLECWLYWMSSNGGLEQLVAAHGVAGSNGDVQLFILSSGKAFGRAAVVGATDTAVLTKFAWHHLVVTYDGANTKLYVDASLRATAASVGGTGHLAPFQIGGFISGAEVCYGLIAEVAEYNFALSAAQVSAHFAAVSSPGVPVSGSVSDFQLTSGGGVPPGPQADLIYAAVHRVFPATS